MNLQGYKRPVSAQTPKSAVLFSIQQDFYGLEQGLKHAARKAFCTVRDAFWEFSNN